MRVEAAVADGIIRTSNAVAGVAPPLGRRQGRSELDPWSRKGAQVDRSSAISILYTAHLKELPSMTYIGGARYSLPLAVQRKPIIGAPAVDPDAIIVVIPIKDDLPGLVRTVCSLLRMNHVPREIRVVDDGSEVPVTVSALERAIGRRLTNIAVHRNARNLGPAYARNDGTRDVDGWVYLTDCACEHPPDLFDQLASARESSADHTTAIATPIAARGDGRLARYMTEQGNLNPPMVDGLPQAVITASVLVHAPAAERIGWFDQRFREAGGENIDFGLRLCEIGRIEWCPTAVVRHEFDECVTDFDKRFRRYGRGLRTLAHKWSVSLKPFEFEAISSDLQALAFRQSRRMLEGYEAY